MSDEGGGTVWQVAAAQAGRAAAGRVVALVVVTRNHNRNAQ